jgi:Ca2+ transporting ATPase
MARPAREEEGTDAYTRGGLLWLRIGRRLRTQVRVAGAFRTAGNIARLRRRTSRLASHAIGGPDARAPRRASDHPVLEAKGQVAPSPARAMWRTAVARLRYQIRVVNAFRSGGDGSPRALTSESGAPPVVAEGAPNMSRQP